MNNVLFSAVKGFKNLIDYTPPDIPEPFVLDETRPNDDDSSKNADQSTEKVFDNIKALNRFGERLLVLAEQVSQALKLGYEKSAAAEFKAEFILLEKEWEKLSVLCQTEQVTEPLKDAVLSINVDVNRKALESIYKLPRNKDLVLKEIEISADLPIPALIVYIDGLVDSKKLDRFVLEPLITLGGAADFYDGDPIDRIIKRVIPSGQLDRAGTYGALEAQINQGGTILIIDGLSEAVIIQTQGWEHRSVSIPQVEQTVRGSQAAFSENLRTNTALIRSVLRSSDLVTEMIKIGKRGQVNCAILYIDSIANTSLVNEVRRRLSGISTDVVVDSGQLMQFIEDYPSILFPQTLSTERPDRAAAHLAEGRIALILDGNPFVQILPIDFFSCFHSAEDYSMKPAIANVMRILRLFGALISTVLPALYLALSYFHAEAMPTELLIAIAGSRDHVPFPAVFEVLMMEVAYELIREAGIRIPGVLGSTIGIVGAIILGQAAVAARIVSPITVVLVAITGLASYTIPEYRMASAIRLIRFILIILAWTLGLVGLAIGLLSITVLLCHIKSFGMPYMTPIGPRTIANYDLVIRGQVFSMEHRPDELNAKDNRRQPTVSRRWTKEPSKKGDKR